MNIIQFNGFWVATDHTLGAWFTPTQTPTQEMLDNANWIRSFFINEGWTLEAITGMMGNMQGESTLNPAFIQSTNRYRLPNSAVNLQVVPNSVMKNFYMEYYGDTRKAYGIGLVQWDGYSMRNNQSRQKLVAYAMDNNINWYDGWTQMYRIRGEQKYDVDNNKHDFFYRVRVNGTYYDFANYPYSTNSPEELASAWSYGYEGNSGGPGQRVNNARWWYNYFTDPNAPAIIPPSSFLSPELADPSGPPFDPDNPPDPSGADVLPGWLIAFFIKKKKRWIK